MLLSSWRAREKKNVLMPEFVLKSQWCNPLSSWSNLWCVANLTVNLSVFVAFDSRARCDYEFDGELGELVRWSIKIKFEKLAANEVHSSTTRCRAARRRSLTWRFALERLAESSRFGTASRSWRLAVRWRAAEWTRARTWSSARRRWCMAWIAGVRREHARQCAQWVSPTSLYRLSDLIRNRECYCCAKWLRC